jgi:monovalent cation:H+ antiporter-2, CPA2 family
LVLLIKLLTTGIAMAALRERPAITAATALMLAQVGEFSFVLERVGGDVGLFPAGLAESGSQAFIAATVLLMVATPALSAAGGLMSRRLDRRAGETAKARMREDAEVAEVTYENVENHVIVAGYGRAARKLVNALSSARIPFVITTLSPAGANEAEEDGHRVLRGDSSRQRTQQLAGIERAKMLVIADDDPAMAERIAAVSRTFNPTLRLVVRTRFESEVRPLYQVGTDRVITEEQESILQVFAEVLRTYRIPPAEIEAREEVIRQGDYAGLVAEPGPGSVAACDLDKDCLDARTVVVRATAAAAGSTIGSLDLGHRFAITVDRVRRDGIVSSGAEPDFVLAPGDELDLRGEAASFAAAAALFRTTPADAAAPQTPVATRTKEIDMEQTIELKPDPRTRCQHVTAIHAVTPSARGCEDCLATGSWWVHLRICMTCGHMGCCDSSPNKHATAHWHATNHPVVRSMEKGEDWGWCYADQEML